MLFAAAGGRSKKRGTGLVVDEEDLGGDYGDSDDGANPEEAQGLVSMRNITKLVKRAHCTKADRMNLIEEGREGRKKYGFQVGLLISLLNIFKCSSCRIRQSIVLHQFESILLLLGDPSSTGSFILPHK